MRRLRRLCPWQILTRSAGAPLACKVMNDVDLDMEIVRAEVGAIVAEYAPSTHSRTDHHDGGWNAIGLIAHDGDPRNDRLRYPLKKTPALSLAPYLESFIDGLAAAKLRVRLLELQPAKSIFWHYDKGESIDGGASARFHLPVVTNSQVRLQISHLDLFWNEGEVWYGDFSFPHRLFNGGRESRVHLVFDLALNDFVLSLFPQEFLRGRETRLRVKGACQRMIDIYEIARLPARRKPARIRRLLRDLTGGGKAAFDPAPARRPL